MFCKTPLLLALHAAHPLPVAPPGPAACVEPQRLAREQGVDGDYTEERLTTHFRMAWDPANPVMDEATVSLFADALETSWSTEIDTLGWKQPDQTDECPITVLVADLADADSGTGGWTDVETEGGVPWIVLNTDWLADGDDWIQTLIAHEFNHASQFAYGVYWEQEDWWYWESTAEWMTDSVYDEPNTYVWSLWDYLDSPWRPLDSMAGVSQYGHLVFNTYLAESYGADTPRAVWAATTEADHVEDAVSRVTAADYDDLLADYAGHMAAMDVEERDVWLEAMGYFEADPVSDHVDTYPADGAVDGAGMPQERGQNFVHLTGTPGDVRFDFTGATEVEGVATEWAVSVATDDGTGTFTHTSVRTSGGVAAVTIEDLGGAVTDAWIAVTPLGAIGANGASYAWTATPVKDGGEGGGGDEDEETKACGCESAVGAPGGLALLLAVLTSRRRR